MRYQMGKLLTAYVDYYVDTLSFAAADARKIAVHYVWDIPAIRQAFGKLELELFAAGLS
jgi:hypothetical protein